MNFLQLTYFMEVARTSHMTQAAENLYISQPALSKSIKLLEKELGTTLFDRDGARIHLNANGEIFHKYCKEILSAMFQAQNEIADNNNRRNEITLSVTDEAYFLPEIISEFTNKHSNIKLNITQESHLNKGNPGCGDLFIYSSDVPVISEDSITLLTERCLVGLSKDSPLSQNDTIKPYMLAEETFLSVTGNASLSQLLNNLCKSGNFPVKDTLQLDNQETLFTLIEKGFGISLIPEKTWGKYASSRNVALCPLSSECNRHIILTWNNNDYMPKSVKTMIEFLKEVYNI